MLVRRPGQRDVVPDLNGGCKRREISGEVMHPIRAA
jgi:hypothetical protein